MLRKLTRSLRERYKLGQSNSQSWVARTRSSDDRRKSDSQEQDLAKADECRVWGATDQVYLVYIEGVALAERQQESQERAKHRRNSAA